MNTLPLSELKPGDKAKIVKIERMPHKLQNHFTMVFLHAYLAMGLLPGKTIRVIRVAPMGDPMMIKVERENRGLPLIIKKNVAKHILVQLIV